MTGDVNKVVSDSARGYLKEDEIAFVIREIASKPQRYYSNFFGRSFKTADFVIDRDSVCTGLKLYLGGFDDKPASEGDVNFLLRVPKKNSSNTFNESFSLFDKLLPSIRCSRNVGIQSKDWSSEVGFKSVNEDNVKAFMTRNIGCNLKANTLIVTKSRGDLLLESKLKSEFPVSIINSSEFTDYEVRHILGVNSIAWRPFDESSESFVNKSLEIGKLALLDDGHSFYKGLKLANLIYIDCIGNEEAYEEVRAPLKAMSTHLNLMHYLYLTKSGVAPKAERFLGRVGAYIGSPNDFYRIILKGDFFSMIPDIFYDPNFSKGKEVIGRAESELEDHVYESISVLDNRLLSYKNIRSCIIDFFNKKF